MSSWESWQPEGSKDLDPKMMLRPLALDDFSRHLAGDPSPLEVKQWRSATVTNDFYYRKGRQVPFKLHIQS